MKQLLRSGIALGLSGLLVTACGSTDSPTKKVATRTGTDARPLAQVEVRQPAKDITGPSTATISDPAITPIVQNPKGTLPTTVTSHDHEGDHKVTITSTARVVTLSISGSLAATAWGLGEGRTLVARDQSTTFPGTAKLPLVTSGAHTVNAEAVLAQHPDVVITDGSIGPRDVVEQLRDSGIKVVFVHNTPSFRGASQLAEDVAAVYGIPDIGHRLADRITHEVATTRAAVAHLAPKEPGRKLRVIFLYLRGREGIYYLFGKGSGADELIDGLDAVDIASEQGWTGMRPMTDEATTKADPDLVLVMTDGIKSAGGIDALLSSKPALALTQAGKRRRFVDMADGDILGFGPRSAAVLDALARAVYAPGTS